MLGQETEVHADTCLAQRIVDETGVAGFIAGHQLEQFGDVLVGPATLHFLVQNTTREFSGARGDQEVDELGAQLWLHPVPIDVFPCVVFFEVALVRVCLHFVDQDVPIFAHGRNVNRVHLVKVSGVETRGQQRVLHRDLRGLL